MKITIKLFIMIIAISLIGINNLYAGEVVMCVNNTDKYVDMVGETGACIEGETQMVVNRSDVEQLMEYQPVANFKTDENCDGEGTITEVGFDQNGNGELDASEMVSASGTCVPYE